MRWKPGSKTLRDLTMFGLGAGGFAHEAFIAKGDRPTFLLACLALMGVPFFLRKDEGDGDDGTRR